MNRDNPLVKLERYRRIRARPEAIIIMRIEREIYALERPYLEIVFGGQRYVVEIQYKNMSHERQKRCKRLRSVRHKLRKTANKIHWEMRKIENR